MSSLIRIPVGTPNCRSQSWEARRSVSDDSGIHMCMSFALEEVVQTGGCSAARAICACRWHPALSTPEVVVLDWSRNGGARRLVLHVPLALCDRTLFSICQAASRVECQPVHANRLDRSLDVAVRAGFLAAALDAGRRGPGCPGLVSPGGQTRSHETNSWASTARGFPIFGEVGFTGSFTQTRWKRKGRSKGNQPPPRKRFPVVKKAKMALDRASPGP